MTAQELEALLLEQIEAARVELLRPVDPGYVDPTDTDTRVSDEELMARAAETNPSLTPPVEVVPPTEPVEDENDEDGESTVFEATIAEEVRVENALVTEEGDLPPGTGVVAFLGRNFASLEGSGAVISSDLLERFFAADGFDATPGPRIPSGPINVGDFLSTFTLTDLNGPFTRSNPPESGTFDPGFVPDDAPTEDVPDANGPVGTSRLFDEFPFG